MESHFDQLAATHPSMDINQRLRMSHVKRWHIVNTAVPQTVAEHTFRVEWITEDLLRTAGLWDYNNNFTLNAVRWAKIHDLPEVILGDTPTPGKERIESMIWSEDPEASFDSDAPTLGGVFHAAHALVDSEWHELYACLQETPSMRGVLWIVKIADLVEAMDFLALNGLGSHAHTVWNGMFRAFEKLTLDYNTYHFPNLLAHRVSERAYRIATVEAKERGWLTAEVNR